MGVSEFTKVNIFGSIVATIAIAILIKFFGFGL